MILIPFSFTNLLTAFDNTASIPTRPGVELTSIKYGFSFSLSFEGIKSTPTISPSTAIAALSDYFFSNFVSSKVSGTEHCENTQYCDDDDDSFDRVFVGGVKFHLY